MWKVNTYTHCTLVGTVADCKYFNGAAASRLHISFELASCYHIRPLAQQGAGICAGTAARRHPALPAKCRSCTASKPLRCRSCGWPPMDANMVTAAQPAAAASAGASRIRGRRCGSARRGLRSCPAAPARAALCPAAVPPSPALSAPSAPPVQPHCANRFRRHSNRQCHHSSDVRVDCRFSREPAAGGLMTMESRCTRTCTCPMEALGPWTAPGAEPK